MGVGLVSDQVNALPDPPRAPPPTLVVIQQWHQLRVVVGLPGRQEQPNRPQHLIHQRVWTFVVNPPRERPSA
jgi:hypothetical protein